MNIKYLLPNFLAHLLNNSQAVAVESVDEGLKDVHVKGRCYDLSMTAPAISRTDQQTISKPRLEEAILIRLIQMYLTVEDDFNVVWMREENNKAVAQESANYVAETVAKLQDKFENFLKKKRGKQIKS